MARVVDRAIELTDAKISFVSLVDAAANKRDFLITKAKDGQAEVKITGRLIRSSAEKHFVTGVVYEPLEEDTHGTFMTAEEIEKAAYWFMKNGSRNNDIQHSFEPDKDCSVVESWIARADTVIGEETVKKGTWLMTVEVDSPEIWEAIENGDITGLSMGGLATYSEEETDLSEIEKNNDTQEKKGILKSLAKILGLDMVERGEVEETFKDRLKDRSFWTAFDSLEDTLRKYNYSTDQWEYEEDETKITEALTDFGNIISNLLGGSTPIAMAIRGPESVENSDKEDLPMKKSDVEAIITKAVNEAVEKITKAAETAEPAEAPAAAEATAETPAECGGETGTEAPAEGTQEAPEAPAAEEPVTRAAVEEMIQAAIAKAAEPKEEVTPEQIQEMVTKSVEAAVQPVLKHVGEPTNLNGSVQNQATEQHYLHGII